MRDSNLWYKVVNKLLNVHERMKVAEKNKDDPMLSRKSLVSVTENQTKNNWYIPGFKRKGFLAIFRTVC